MSSHVGTAAVVLVAAAIWIGISGNSARNREEAPQRALPSDTITITDEWLDPPLDISDPRRKNLDYDTLRPDLWFEVRVDGGRAFGGDEDLVPPRYQRKAMGWKPKAMNGDYVSVRLRSDLNGNVHAAKWKYKLNLR